MSEELKPCPFCGGMPKVNDWTLKGITDKRCFCDNEKCPVYLSKTIAIDDWNTRPIEDALNARIAELEANIEILKDQQREARNILIDKNLQIDSLYEEGYKLQQRIAELEAENAALKAEPKPLAYWSDEKKQTYADNEGRSAKRSEE